MKKVETYKKLKEEPLENLLEISKKYSSTKDFTTEQGYVSDIIKDKIEEEDKKATKLSYAISTGLGAASGLLLGGVGALIGATLGASLYTLFEKKVVDKYL